MKIKSRQKNQAFPDTLKKVTKALTHFTPLITLYTP